MAQKTLHRVKKLRGAVSIKYRSSDRIESLAWGAVIRGRGHTVILHVGVLQDWPEDASIVIDTTQFKGECELNVNHQIQDGEHVLIVTSVIGNEKKESMLRLKDIPVLHVDIDERAKIRFKAELNGIQFVVSPSREEAVTFDSGENQLNFFNGFRKILVDLEKKLHVEVHADEITDDIRI
jgi:hypothetical protein